MRRAFRLYEKATNKDASVVLNRAGGNVCLRAAQLTQKAKHSDMRTTAAWDPDKRPSNDKTRFHYAWFRKRNGRNGSKQEVKQWFNKRKASRGFGAAGFLNPARDFGKRIRSRPIRGKQAAKSRGEKAKPTNLVGWIYNESTVPTNVLGDGFRRAKRYVIADMLKYARRKMRGTARRYSAR